MFFGKLHQHMVERIDAKLHVIAGGGFQGVVANAAVFTPHKKHGLRHDLMQFHGIVARATGHDVKRNAQAGQGVLPTPLPFGCARCSRRSEASLRAGRPVRDVRKFRPWLSRCLALKHLVAGQWGHACPWRRGSVQGPH
jgi:hypothetical protein